MEIPWSEITRAATRAVWYVPSCVREDAYQEALLAAWRASDKYDPALMPLDLYLLRYARWAAKTFCRDWLNARHGNDPPSFTDIETIIGSHSLDPRRWLETNLYCAKLLAGLTPQQRDAILDTYWEGLSGEEAALKRNVTDKTVSYHKVRALKALRKKSKVTP